MTGRKPVIKSPLEEKLKEKSSVYFDLYEKLRDWANAQWTDHNDIFEQIRHSIGHSKKLHSFADIILKHKIQKDDLNEKEIFLLLSSIYLHDIGMQTGWKEYLEIKGVRGYLTSEERKEIRKKHSKTIGDIIRGFKKKLPPELKDHLSPTQKEVICNDLNEALAFICESHDKPEIANNLKEDIDQKIPGTFLKIGFIACMLQFCDLLHMDKSRLNETNFMGSLEKFLAGDSEEACYMPEDWKRFFCCYYVEDVSVTPYNKQGSNIFSIQLHCRYHTEETEEIKNIFQGIYRKRLTRFQYDCITELNANDIHFVDAEKIFLLEPDSSKKRFPPQIKIVLEIPKEEGMQVAHFSLREEEPQTNRRPITTDSQILNKVWKEIAAVLKEARLKPFKEALIHQLQQNENISFITGGKPEEALTGAGVLEAIYILERAVDYSFKTIQKTRGERELVKVIWEGAVEILGWLVLLSVNYQWVEEQKKQGSNNKGIKLEIPVKTEAGIEIIFSGYLGTQAKLGVDETKTMIHGKNRIPISMPESGEWKDINIVNDIKRNLWKILFKKDPPAFIDPDQTETLNTRIQLQNRQNQNIYISIPREDKGNPLRTQETYKQLQREMPDLHAIIITIEESEKVLVVSEPEQEGYLLEFFKHKPE